MPASSARLRPPSCNQLRLSHDVVSVEVPVVPGLIRAVEDPIRRPVVIE
jgi:hypothetical protein